MTPCTPRILGFLCLLGVLLLQWRHSLMAHGKAPRSSSRRSTASMWIFEYRQRRSFTRILPNWRGHILHHHAPSAGLLREGHLPDNTHIAFVRHQLDWVLSLGTVHGSYVMLLLLFWRASRGLVCSSACMRRQPSLAWCDFYQLIWQIVCLVGPCALHVCLAQHLIRTTFIGSHLIVEYLAVRCSTQAAHPPPLTYSAHTWLSASVPVHNRVCQQVAHLFRLWPTRRCQRQPCCTPTYHTAIVLPSTPSVHHLQ